MATANTFRMMGQFMKKKYTTINLMAFEFTFCQMIVNTTENGRTIICIVKESMHRKMVESMKKTKKMIESMLMVFTPETMVKNMKVGRKTVNSMESESTERIVGKEEESGKIDREQNCLMTKI